MRQKIVLFQSCLKFWVIRDLNYCGIKWLEERGNNLKVYQLKNKQKVVLHIQMEYYTAAKRHNLPIALATPVTTLHTDRAQKQH